MRSNNLTSLNKLAEGMIDFAAFYSVLQADGLWNVIGQFL